MRDNRRFPATLAVAAALLALVAGCSNAPAAQGGTPGSGNEPKATRIVMAVVPPLKESNETRNLGSPDMWPMRPMYEYLIGLDAQTGAAIPQLATAWKVDPDGRSFRFTLRKGVMFHGGNGEFTAKDLIQPWKEVIKEDSLAGAAATWRADVRDIEIVNDYEAVYRLNQPDGFFLSTISENRGGMEMFSKRDFDARGAPSMTDAPIAGTAAYEFAVREQGSYLRFRRSAQPHWQQQPEAAEVEFRFMKEPSTRLASLLVGEAQMADLPEDLQKQAEQQGFKSVAGKVSSLRLFMTIYCCFLNDPTKPALGYKANGSPLQDARVRKALNKAINRDELNRSFLGGKAELMAVNPFHPSRPGWSDDFTKRFPEAYGYDPAAASALLTEAGYGRTNQLETNILLTDASGFPNAKDMGEAIAGYWGKVGVKVNLVQQDTAEISKLSRQFTFTNHFQMVGTSSDIYTGTVSRGFSFLSRGSGLELPDGDAATVAIQNTLDENEQENLFRRVAEVRFSQYQAVPLFWVPAEITVNSKVVTDYLFPGAVTGNWSHVQNIKLAR